MMIRGDEHKDRGPMSDGVLSGHVDDWEELAVDYLDGVLDPQSKAAVEAHLRDCPACAARLRTEERLIAFLEDIDYVEPPAHLEDKVQDAIVSLHLSKTKAASTAPASGTSRWETFWRRKVVPWVPATIGVVAVLAGILAFGIARDGVKEDAVMTTAGAAVAQNTAERTPDASTTAVPMSDSSQDGDSAALGSVSQGSGGIPTTTAGAATTTMAAPTEATAAPTETAAPPTETSNGTATGGAVDTATETTTGITAATAAGPDHADAVRDAKTMVADLEAAAAPVCFVLETPGSSQEGADGQITGGADDEAGTAIAQQFTALTGLEPLNESLWIDGPTFAAYVPRGQAKQLVELLISIGNSFKTGVSLTQRPLTAYAGSQETTPGSSDTGADDAFARLLKKKADFVELSAYRTPAPAVTTWSFTTSTLPAAMEQPDAGAAAPLPDELGTHVLVFIYLDR